MNDRVPLFVFFTSVGNQLLASRGATLLDEDD